MQQMQQMQQIKRKLAKYIAFRKYYEGKSVISSRVVPCYWPG
jgi:hypothetical protein